jgi:Fe-S-cluster-containing hydrogenase component 2
MGLLFIDETKCKKDGICVRDCPMVVIKQKDGDGFPEIVPGGEDICNSCGHCVSICPQGALSHARVPIEKSPLIEKDLEVSEDQAVQFLRSRRSIRFFEKKPVEREKLKRLIEIARYAPTGGNLQLVEWVVFTDEDKIRTIAERTVEWMRKVLAKAPASVPPYFPLIVRPWSWHPHPRLRPPVWWTSRWRFPTLIWRPRNWAWAPVGPAWWKAASRHPRQSGRRWGSPPATRITIP